MSYHDPVMLTECIEGLQIDPAGIYIDATFGGGGHAREIIKKINTAGHLYGFDQDEDALANTLDADNFTFVGDLLKVVDPLIRGQRNKYLSQVFQAIRIEVNEEMEVLKDFLTASLKVLKPGGRLVIMSYHSLEDRLVKNFFKSGNFDGELEKDFYGNINRPFKLITKKAVSASKEELKINSRSRSARLRIAEKLAEPNG